MKKLITISFILLNIIAASAQKWEWVNECIDAGQSGVHTICLDKNENTYITGIYHNPATFGTLTLSANASNTNIYLVKYNSNGTALWAKTVGYCSSSSSVTVSANAIDKEGNSYITGGFTGSVYLGATLLSAFDGGSVFTAKYDSLGNLKWAESGVQEGSGTGGTGASVACDTAGHVYITGYFSGASLDFGAISLNNSVNEGTNDIFIVKYDSLGNVIWGASGGGSSDDLAYGITVDAKGNAYVTGRFSSKPAIFGMDTITSAGYPDIFVAKYDSSGHAIWARQAGSRSGFDEGEEISLDQSGNIYVNGFFADTSGWSTDTLIAHGSNNMFIAKYNNNGSFQWVRNGTGAGGNISVGIYTNVAGSSAVVGQFKDTVVFSTDTVRAIGTQDIFVAVYDSGGALTWVKQAGGISKTDGVFGVAYSNSNNCYVYGISFGPSVFDTITIPDNTAFIGKIGVQAPPVCAFAATKTSTCMGAAVNFNDLSTNFPNHWSWSFTGGSPDTSSAKNPVVTYNDTGIYSVKLLVSNSAGKDSLTLTNYITVNPLPAVPVITPNNAVLNSSSLKGNQWYLNGTILHGDTLATYTVTQDGNYTVTVTDSNGCSSVSQTYYFSTVGITALTKENKLTVTPNPSDGPFQIRTNDLQGCGIKIYDITGRLVFQSEIQDGDVTVNLPVKGIYCLRVESSGESFSKKLIVQ